MDEFKIRLIIRIIISVLITAISYGAYPYLFSKTRKEPVAKRTFMWSCIGYTFFIWFLYQMIYILLEERTGRTDPAFLWGMIFYYNAKGRLRGKGILTENPSRKKKEKPNFDVTEQQYNFAMQITNYGVHSKEIKDIAQEMKKTPKETMDYFYEVIRNYNLKRYGKQDHTEQVFIKQEQQAALPEPVEAEPEPSEKEPEIQRWYTCPKCGQLVKDGEECDCEAVKLALEEGRKKKEEQKQQKRRELKKALPLYAVCAVLLVTVCALGIYSYNLKTELDDLSEWNDMISSRNENQKEEIQELKNEKKELEWKNSIQTDRIQELAFLDHIIGFVPLGSKIYHRYTCEIFQDHLNNDGFYQAHNIEYCEYIGCSKCKDCW